MSVPAAAAGLGTKPRWLQAQRGTRTLRGGEPVGGPVRQVTTRVAAQELNVLIREKAGPEAQDAGPGGPFSTASPLQPVRLGLGRSHRKSVEKGSLAARTGRIL